jgi:hypothetical protein
VRTFIATADRHPSWLEISLTLIALLSFLTFLIAGLRVILPPVLTSCRRSTARRRAARMQREQWSQRPPLSDEAFLLACHVPPGSFEAKVALATRHALAEQGTGTPPETLCPDDSLFEPIWDGTDWTDVVFRVERIASIRIPSHARVDLLNDLPNSSSALRVHHLAHTLAVTARPLATPEHKPYL